LREGIFFFVVGPSGSGKDSLINGARAVLEPERFVFARRVITRPVGAPGEDHEAATEQEFSAREARGDFLITWKAHDLRYGLPGSLKDELAAGRHVIANGSRAMVAELAERVARFVVIEITAPPVLLAQRIAGRGRETGAAIDKRVARIPAPWPASIRPIKVANDGTLNDGISRFILALRSAAITLRLKRVPIFAGRDYCAYLPANSEALSAFDYLGSAKVELAHGHASIRTRVQVIDDPDLLASDCIGLSSEAFADLGVAEGVEVSFRRTPLPESRAALVRKIQGESLSEEQYHTLIRDIVESRYPDSEVSAFLVAACRNLTDSEVLSLARVRTQFAERIVWPQQMVVDKHSMGGIPGSRITLIVVPIVAAHGRFLMPKTSSRAITSAAGTADAMEALANVEISPSELRACLQEAGACIAWNARLNHSTVDDVMNAITQPLSIDSNRWSVASILSKKYTAGSTHVIVDLPYGPRAKLKTEAAAVELGQLFESVGRGLGLTVAAVATDGSQPIGRGIGPALEARDAMWVLENHPEAPQDLAEKSLFFASRILAWDPEIGSVEAGRRRAEELLRSGAALQAMQRIIDAQGRRVPPILPGVLTHRVTAKHNGMVEAIDSQALTAIARRAGAPLQKSAGVDLLCRLGDRVVEGQPLLVLHAGTPGDLEEASRLAESNPAYVLR
jgi:thymidine phosphorylase